MIPIFPGLSVFPLQTPPALLASASTDRVEKGTSVNLNGRRFSIAWSQWQDGGRTRVGLSDTGARELFGIELLSADEPGSQPINWFSLQNLPTRFIAPYRYLDVTDLLRGAGAEVSVLGDTLTIAAPLARIQELTGESYGEVKRFVLRLDRPTFWQVSRAKNAGAITVGGTAGDALGARFGPSPVAANPPVGDEDDLGSGGNPYPTGVVALESAGSGTRLKLSLPGSGGLQIASVANPDRIVIDIRPDPMAEKRIVWQEGLIWNQKYIPLDGVWFPVTWLEIDPKNPRVALRPIVATPDSSSGTKALATIGGDRGASAAINGGFFNRNNRLPLGAIRVAGRWLSGPILGRGAIAWDERGNFRFGRLRLQETLIAGGRRFPLSHLNSAYLQTGLARYTREWGETYTPLTDAETVISIAGGRVISRGENASGKESFPIPDNGYLVIARKTGSPLTVGNSVELESEIVPADLANYPHVIGAGPLLLENGRVVLDPELEKFSKAFREQRASRSAIALTRDAKVLLVALHNRVGGRGATLAEFARLLRAMGADSALNLDGGSSTGIVLGGQTIDRDPVTAANVHNGIGVFVSPSP